MDIEEKKKVFQAQLEEKQRTRQQKLQKKKVEELEKKNPQEHMLYIQKQFKAKSQIVQDELKLYKAKQISFPKVNESYSNLKQYYVNISYALKTYDRQSYKQSLDKLYTTMIDLKKRFEPRKKFKFSRRGEDFGVKLEETAEIQKIKESSENNIPGIMKKVNETLVLKDEGVISAYKIVQCENTNIDILHKTQIMFLKKLKNCTIRAALTKSTVFVDECEGCTLQINCHQLRIHNTFKTSFKIFVTSKAIIEDCKQVTFTPYQFAYENKEKDEEMFERKGKENLWREIQDFNWLKENIKSPHYDLIQP